MQLELKYVYGRNLLILFNCLILLQDFHGVVRSLGNKIKFIIRYIFHYIQLLYKNAGKTITFSMMQIIKPVLNLTTL